MELKDFILSALERAQSATTRALDGLTQDEIKWRPGPEANSIGIILLHLARVEDSWVSTMIQGKTQLWETEKWYEKLNLPVTEVGAHYTVEQLAAVLIPDLKLLLAYYQAVRVKTVEYIKTVPVEQFDKLVKTRRGDSSIGHVFALLVVHIAEHAGDISYIRGLQRGLDK